MPKLPDVGGAELLRLLRSLGYEVVRQHGSHVRMTKRTTQGEHHVTVLMHKTIPKGTLHDTLSKVSIWNNISEEELIERLK